LAGGEIFLLGDVCEFVRNQTPAIDCSRPVLASREIEVGSSGDCEGPE
jgi:hypothetical protein